MTPNLQYIYNIVIYNHIRSIYGNIILQIQHLLLHTILDGWMHVLLLLGLIVTYANLYIVAKPYRSREKRDELSHL